MTKKKNSNTSKKRGEARKPKESVDKPIKSMDSNAPMNLAALEYGILLFQEHLKYLDLRKGMKLNDDEKLTIEREEILLQININIFTKILKSNETFTQENL